MTEQGREKGEKMRASSFSIFLLAVITCADRSVAAVGKRLVGLATEQATEFALEYESIAIFSVLYPDGVDLFFGSAGNCRSSGRASANRGGRI